MLPRKLRASLPCDNLRIRAAHWRGTGWPLSNAWRFRRGKWRRWSTGSCSIMRNGNLPLDITSASIAWMPATTICSHPRRGSAILSRLRKGNLPQESWFALGRLLTTYGGDATLLSWSGSMFEYLMPLLVMPTFDNTLLDQTCKAAVRRQIDYGEERGVPWGISESGLQRCRRSIQLPVSRIWCSRTGTQARPGGGPGHRALCFRAGADGRARGRVPQPSATGGRRYGGKFGFYEAVDYTPSRLRRGETRAVVRSFMAHHQGMSLLSLAYLLLDRPMQRRFTV